MYFSLIKNSLLKQKFMNLFIFALIAVISAVILASISIFNGLDYNMYRSLDENNRSYYDMVLRGDTSSPDYKEAVEYFEKLFEGQDGFTYYKYMEYVFEIPEFLDDEELSRYQVSAIPQGLEIAGINIKTDKTTNKLDFDEVYIPYIFKDDYKIGDTIEVIINEKQYKLSVVGYNEDPFFGHEFNTGKYFIVSDEYFDELSTNNPNGFAYYGFNSTTDDKLAVTDVVKEILNDEEKAYFQEKGVHLDGFGVSEIVSFLTVLPKITISSILLVSVVSIIILLLIIRHSIKTFIENNYKNYGILYSLGFSSTQLIRINVFRFFILAIFAFIVAIPLSFIVAQPLGELLTSSVGFFWESEVNMSAMLVVLFIILGVIMIFTFISSRRIAKISPVQAISNGRPDVHYNHLVNINLQKMNSKNLMFKLSVKKIFANLSSYIIIIILTLLMSFLTLFGVNMSNVTSDNNQLAELFDVSSRLYVRSFDIQHTEEAVNEVKKNFDVSDVREANLLRVEYKNTGLVLFGTDDISKVSIGKVIEGRLPKNDNEIAISLLNKKVFDKQIGDEMIFEIDGKEYKYIVSGFVQSLIENGSMVYMLDSGFDKIDSHNIVENRLVYFKNDNDITKAEKFIEKKYGDNVEAVEVNMKKEPLTKAFRDLMTTVKYFVLGVSISLLAVLVFMLTNMSMIKEKRDIGIMKGIGFTRFQIKKQIIYRMIILSVIGSTIGSILAYKYISSFIVFLDDGSTGIRDFPTLISSQDIIMLVVVQVLVTLVFAFLAITGINRISIKDMVLE